MTQLGNSPRFFGALVALAWLGSCSDGSGPVCCDPPPLEGLIVSNPVASAALTAETGGALALGAGAGPDVAYVSLAPGTVPAGSRASVRRVGDAASVTTAVTDGGFDPVPVTAQAGDSIDVTVTDDGGAVVLQLSVRVAAARPPVIVRTEPPPKKRDVPLNAVMVIVFSEPMNASTLNSPSVQLLRGTTPVVGTVSLLPGSATAAVFTPDAVLDANTDYQLVVTQGVRDLNGEALTAAVTVDFTTGASMAGPVASVTPTPATPTLLLNETLQMTASVRDANGVPLSGRPIAWRSEPPGVATVDSTGMVRGVTPGSAAVIATSEGVSGTAAITVLAPLGPTEAIAFARHRGDTDVGIFVITASGLTRLTSDTTIAYSPEWSPDGGKIAYNGSEVGSNDTQVYSINADGTGVTQLTSDSASYDPAWSPDGSKIAYASYSHIYLMKADGTSRTELTNDSSSVATPAWSPDGTRIAFVSQASGIELINADGSGRRQLTVGRNPAWSPDGSRIAFSPGTQIYVINSDGSGLKSLTANGWRKQHVQIRVADLYRCSLTKTYDPAWSPDGTRIAYAWSASVTAWTTNGGITCGYYYGMPPIQSQTFGIGVMSADGTGRATLTTGTTVERHPTWKP